MWGVTVESDVVRSGAAANAGVRQFGGRWTRKPPLRSGGGGSRRENPSERAKEKMRIVGHLGSLRGASSALGRR